MFGIIYYLLNREITTARELSDKFEVSTRTIYRDIEELSSMGIPIYMTKGKGGGISLLPNFILDKTVLTDDEKAEILSSLQAVKEVDLSSKNEILQKFTSLFGDSYVDWIEVDFSSWYNYKNQESIFNDLKKAILNKNVVQFEYFNSKGQSQLRIVEPVKLYFKGRAWYLYAYCRKRCDYRFFKLIRMKELNLLDESVAVNRNISSINAQFALEYNSSSKKELIHLKLKISKELSYRVYEEFENYTLLEDGSFLVEIDFPDEEWLFYYISTLGHYCKVLEPKEIRDRYIKYLQKTLDLYK